MTRHSSFADWLAAVDALRPAGEQEEQAIARCLGLHLKQRAQTSPAAPKGDPARALAEPEEAAAAEAATAPPDTKPRRRVASVLVPANVSRRQAPAWLVTVPHLDRTEDAHIRTVLPLEPLFPARTSRAILSSAMATPSENGPMDLARVIDRLSRAEPVTEVPRRPLPTLARGVQLLIDQSETLQPFALDQVVLRSALVSVAGRDRTSVLYFEGSPLWGAGTGIREDWLDYQAPAAGTSVVVLTDLGITRAPGVPRLAGTGDWKEFAAVLARKQCPLLALVPYPASCWPAGLAKTMTIIQWDRATTAAVVRRLIGNGLRVANPC